MLEKYQDYEIMAECGQEFEGLVPKMITKVGAVGECDETVSVFDQGEGMQPLATPDYQKLNEAEAAE